MEHTSRLPPADEFTVHSLILTTNTAPLPSEHVTNQTTFNQSANNCLADIVLVRGFAVGPILSPCVTHLTSEEFGSQFCASEYSWASSMYDLWHRSNMVFQFWHPHIVSPYNGHQGCLPPSEGRMN